jgi:hypothetical protein
VGKCVAVNTDTWLHNETRGALSYCCCGQQRIVEINLVFACKGRRLLSGHCIVMFSRCPSDGGVLLGYEWRISWQQEANQADYADAVANHFALTSDSFVCKLYNK